MCFEIDGIDPHADIARQLEREVFQDSWGNDAATMKQEYGPYDDSSTFFLAIDTQAQQPAGVLRMIRNSPAGLKTIVDLDCSIKSPIAPVAIPAGDVMRHHGIDDLDRCWDGATAAVPRRYRRKLTAIHLQMMGVVAAAAIRDNIQDFVAVLDAPVFRAAAQILGLPVVGLRAGGTPGAHGGARRGAVAWWCGDGAGWLVSTADRGGRVRCGFGRPHGCDGRRRSGPDRSGANRVGVRPVPARCVSRSRGRSFGRRPG